MPGVVVSSVPRLGGGGPAVVCLSLSAGSRYLLTVNPPSPLPHLWATNSLTSPLAPLPGHKAKVTVGDFCRNTEDQLITCSRDRVILWSVGGAGGREGREVAGGGVTVARDMGEMSCCRLQVDTEARRGWAVLGVGSALWVLGLRYNKQTRAGRLQLNTVEKHAVIETSHSGNISDIWLQPASDFLLSAAEDCKVKIWSFKGELMDTIVGSRYPVNCISVNTDHLIAVGDCGGNLRIYQKLENNLVNIVTSIDIAAFFKQHLQSEDNQSNPVLGCDILTLRLEETELLAGESREEDLPSLLSAKMRVTEDVTNTRQTVLVGTTLGFCLLDLRSRSVLEISVFSQLLSTPSPPLPTSPPVNSTLSSLASRLSVSRSVSAVVAVLQSSLDSKCWVVSVPHKLQASKEGEETSSDTDSGCFLISLEEEEVQEDNRSLSVIPRDNLLSGSVLDLNCKGKEMSKQSVSLMKRGSSLAPLEKMRSRLGKPVKSSGYGKEQKVVMFQPAINRPRVKENRSEPDLTSSHLQSEGCKERRARWSLGSSTGSTAPPPPPAVSAYSETEVPPSQLAARLRVWEETGRAVVVHSPQGRHLAVSGGRNIIQVMSSSPALPGPGQAMVGHSLAVTSLDWARTGHWLVSAGQDNSVKVWDWSSRRVLMEPSSRQGAREAGTLYTQPVNMARFFYMDNILLSVSGNKLFIHSLKLPENPGQIESSHYKLMTTMSCVNQFFSFLALVGCSDRSVRVYDLNQGKVLRSLANCHSRPVYSILQNQGSPRLSHPDRGYDLFLTAALGDGASLWDLRRAGSVCVQKFDSVVAGRHQCGLALSPCMRFLAAGGEDGHLTIYDTRQVRGPLARLNTNTDVITSVSFSPSKPALVCASLDGTLTTFHTETLNKEL